MPLFICRWQNGDFSAVSAPSKEAAVELLDEVANAEDCELFSVNNFSVHFHLKPKIESLEGELPIELEGFGERTLEMLFERVYPVYDKLLSGATEGLSDASSQEQRDAALKKANDGLVTERNRQCRAKERELSDDPEVAQLQTQLDMPKRMSEKAVKERRQRQVVEMPASTDKLQ
jgi:hypothetical protein